MYCLQSWERRRLVVALIGGLAERAKTEAGVERSSSALSSHQLSVVIFLSVSLSLYDLSTIPTT